MMLSDCDPVFETLQKNLQNWLRRGIRFDVLALLDKVGFEQVWQRAILQRQGTERLIDGGKNQR